MADNPTKSAGAHLSPFDSILLSVAQVCLYLGGVSESKVWAMASSGKIPAPVKIDRMTRWRRAEIDAWVSKLENS